MAFQTIPEMFWTNTEQYADHPCMGYKVAGVWKTYTFAQVAERVREVAAGLASLGIEREDKISIVSDNSPKWAITDYAVLSIAAVTVPVYPTLLPHQIKYLLNDGDVKIIFAENKVQIDKITEIFDDLDELLYVIAMDNEQYEQDYIIRWEDLREKGREFIEKESFSLEDRWKSLSGEDMLTIIYTSGTTGEPKGVMLTHGNMTSNIEGGLDRLDVSPEYRFLSFLPLSHSFERMAGHFLATSAGATIYYAESIETVPENMVEVKPNVMTSVPRLYEKMYMRVNEAAQQGSGLKKKIFHWAFEVGKEYQQKRRTGKISGGLNFRYNLATKLVFSKLYERVGGEIKFFVSGGAPLSPDIARFFESAGLYILEGYGLTETTPVIAVNGLDDYKIGTVGKPLFNVEVKIADDGEVLTRGPHVMKGYYKRPEDTKEAIDGDNWLHTGDIGELDEDGFLKITDRKKNLIVTSGGKNVAPQPIENSLINSPYIEQVMLIGDKRNFISALVVPAFDAVKSWATEKNLNFDSNEELIALQEVVDLFESEIDNRTENFARYEQVKQFRLLPKELTIEDGELTPTLKIKRRIVEEEFKDLISDIYKGAMADVD